MDALPEKVSQWSRRIAVEIDPDYEPLAPMYLAAYLRGGNERRQLFEQVATVGGVAAGGGRSLLPYAFAVVSGIAAQAARLCGGGGLALLSDLLTLWKNWLELVQVQKDSAETADASRDKPDELMALRRVLATVQRELAQQGLPVEQCELITFRVMKALLDRPEEAAELLTLFRDGTS
ncbi:MAG: hypothetical protein AB7E77_13575 [Desulfobulbus sp.]